MFEKCSCFLTFCLYIDLSISTNLQFKENFLSKGNNLEIIVPELLSSPPKLERVVRHTELKSGNVMSHLLNEVSNGKHNTDDGNSNQFIKRALRIIQIKLKRLMRNKHKKAYKKIKSTSTKGIGE